MRCVYVCKGENMAVVSWFVVFSRQPEYWHTTSKSQLAQLLSQLPLCFKLRLLWTDRKGEGDTRRKAGKEGAKKGKIEKEYGADSGTSHIPN